MTSVGRCPVIGLVGGIGSGKSQVAAVLAKRGGRVVSGDPAGHEALRQASIREQIVARLGRAILDEQGQIDRKKVGEIVFADADRRRELEAIVHPWIGKRLREEIEKAQDDPTVPFIVLDAAVMLEGGWDSACDFLVFVDAPRAQRLERVASKRGWNEGDVDARERAQISIAAKAARADAQVVNSGTLADLEFNVDVLLEQLGVAPSAIRR